MDLSAMAEDDTAIFGGVSDATAQVLWFSFHVKPELCMGKPNDWSQEDNPYVLTEDDFDKDFSYCNIDKENIEFMRNVKLMLVSNSQRFD